MSVCLIEFRVLVGTKHDAQTKPASADARRKISRLESGSSPAFLAALLFDKVKAPAAGELPGPGIPMR